MDRILFEKGRFFFLNLFLLNLLGESDRQAQVACRIITSDLPPLHTHTQKGVGVAYFVHEIAISLAFSSIRNWPFSRIFFSNISWTAIVA